MNADKKVIATFKATPNYKLVVKRSGKGTVTSVPEGITCGSDCNEAYRSGTDVTLTAQPDSGYVFFEWSGGFCSGSADCNLTMSQAKTVTAVFAKAQK